MTWLSGEKKQMNNQGNKAETMESIVGKFRAKQLARAKEQYEGLIRDIAEMMGVEEGIPQFFKPKEIYNRMLSKESQKTKAVFLSRFGHKSLKSPQVMCKSFQTLEAQGRQIGMKITISRSGPLWQINNGVVDYLAIIDHEEAKRGNK